MDRIKVFQVLIITATVIVLLRLIYWQFVKNLESRESSSVQNDQIPAPRGDIYASDGFPLVTNQEAFLVYAKPNELKEKPEDIAKKLALFFISEKYATSESNLSDEDQKNKEKEIEEKNKDLIKNLSNRNLFWVQLARKIPSLIKQKVEEQKITGLDFERDEKRFYPEASMAAHLLGFAGSNKFGEVTGYFGLEGFYDRILRGKAGRLGQESDPFGFPILVGKYRPVEPKKGASLKTTIDRSIQFIVENKLKQAVEKYQAKEGTVIISDPKTGNILSMATYPNYQPALYSEYDEKLYKNSAVADTYEPGSTFKLITIAAALDLSIITPQTKCAVCTGPRQIGGFEISTWNKKYYPDSTMIEVIEHSDNIGMTFVADKLGIDKFYDYITKFGFGKPTKIDLQEEASGDIRAKDQWRPIDLATASFGQGIAVTPIQMIQAVGAIASGGKLLSPKVVTKIIDNGKEDNVKTSEGQVISLQTAVQITEMMVNAVEKGEARAFAPKGYRIAGKTGTAQIPVAGHYDPNKTIASFVGFAPADNPRFVMLVRFTEPSSSPFGSETAAPTFFAIAQELFNYFGISPSG